MRVRHPRAPPYSVTRVRVARVHASRRSGRRDGPPGTSPGVTVRGGASLVAPSWRRIFLSSRRRSRGSWASRSLSAGRARGRHSRCASHGRPARLPCSRRIQAGRARGGQAPWFFPLQRPGFIQLRQEYMGPRHRPGRDGELQRAQRRRLAMGQEEARLHRQALQQPVQQLGMVGMAGIDSRLRIRAFTLISSPWMRTRCFAFQQQRAQRARRLIADDQHRGVVAPEMVLQMVADAPGIAHARGRDDDGAAGDILQRAAFGSRSRKRRPACWNGLWPLPASARLSRICRTPR